MHVCSFAVFARVEVVALKGAFFKVGNRCSMIYTFLCVFNIVL